MSTTPTRRPTGPTLGRPVTDADGVSLRTLRLHAAKLIAGLGPAPEHPALSGAWLERYRARALFLAGLADWNAAQLRRAALGLVDQVDGAAQQMLFDAARRCSN